MSAAEPPRIVAAIGGEGQQAAMIAAGQQLADCVGFALAADWPVRLRLIDPDEAEIPSGIVLVASPIEDLANNDPIASVEARWIARIGRYRSAGHDRILLCNMFRHVDRQARATGGIERIRRLNRLAIGLSRGLGVEVVDIDRLLALCGARTVGADFRCGGEVAAQLVGHAIADAILQGDMGDCLDGAVQARAIAAHGGVRDIRRLIERYVPGGVAA